MVDASEPGCRTLVVSRGKRKPRNKRCCVVRTPLDVIAKLEQERDQYEAVVLTDEFANDRELTAFLVEAYPALRIVQGRGDDEPDSYLPTFA
jgi:hypothetical protein